MHLENTVEQVLKQHSQEPCVNKRKHITATAWEKTKDAFPPSVKTKATQHNRERLLACGAALAVLNTIANALLLLLGCCEVTAEKNDYARDMCHEYTNRWQVADPPQTKKSTHFIQ